MKNLPERIYLHKDTDINQRGVMFTSQSEFDEGVEYIRKDIAEALILR